MKTYLLVLPLLLAPVPSGGRQDPAPAEFLCPPCGAECHFVSYTKPGACGTCGMKLVPRAEVLQVGVLLHPDVDLCSSTWTLGVFAASNGVRAFTVADTSEPLRAADALELRPQFDFAGAPTLDVLVVPDGWGAWDDELVVEWVRKASGQARFVIAAGAGSVVLARAGFLAGEHVALNEHLAQRRAELAPGLVNDPAQRLGRAGKFFLARDPQAAVEASVAVLRELLGDEVARHTAERLGLAPAK